MFYFGKAVAYERWSYTEVQLYYMYLTVVPFQQILYKPNTQSDFDSVETGNVQSYLLTGLTAGVTYIIQVNKI